MNTIINPEDTPNLPAVVATPEDTNSKVECKITIKQPKVPPVPRERKPMTDKQRENLDKARAKRAQLAVERQAAYDAARDAERLQREALVKQAEEEAKKITPNVVVEKVRGHKRGVKLPPRKPKVEPVPAVIPPPPVALPPPANPWDNHLTNLRSQGIHIPEGCTPYMLKMIMSRYRKIGRAHV